MSYKPAKIKSLAPGEAAYRITDQSCKGEIVAVHIESVDIADPAPAEASAPIPRFDGQGHFAGLSDPAAIRPLRRTAHHRVIGRWVTADGSAQTWPSGQPVTAIHRHTCHGDIVSEELLIAELLDGTDAQHTVSSMRRTIAAAQAMAKMAPQNEPAGIAKKSPEKPAEK